MNIEFHRSPATVADGKGYIDKCRLDVKVGFRFFGSSVLQCLFDFMIVIDNILVRNGAHPHPQKWLITSGYATAMSLWSPVMMLARGMVSTRIISKGAKDEVKRPSN